MFKQTGIVNVTSVEEVVDCAVAFHYLPLPKGHRIAIISGQGGTGVGTADNCYAMGLELPRLGRATIARLREVLPPVGTSVGNPTDTGVASLLDPEPLREGHRDRGRRRGHRHDPGHIDAGPGLPGERGGRGQQHQQAAGRVGLRAAGVEPEIYTFLSEQGVAAYPDPKRAVYALARMAEYASSE